MRMKQLVSIITATALCLPTYGIWAAYGTGEFNEETRNYIYSNGYDKSAEKGNLGYDMKLIDDPTDSSNKIMQVYDNDGGRGTAFASFATGPVNSGWDKKPTYEDKGIDGSKKTYMASDIYLPSALLENVGEDSTDANSTIFAGISADNGIDLYSYMKGIKINKTPNRDTFTITSLGGNGSTIELPPDEWFNLKFETQIGKAEVTTYINNKYFDIGSFASWLIPGYWGKSHMCTGILFRSKIVMNTGFYVDNSVIYELAEQGLELSIADYATDVPGDTLFEAKCASAINADDFQNKIIAEDAEGNVFTAVVSQVDENTVGFRFAGLIEKTEYTVTIGATESGEAYIAQTRFHFTTKADEFMSVVCDLQDGATVKPGDYTVTLRFSKKVSLETAQQCITIIDEDGNAATVEFEYVDPAGIILKLTDLSELTGYKLVVDGKMTSVDGLPLFAELSISFRTYENESASPEDPYIPQTNEDTVILNQSQIEAGKWYIAGGTASDAVVESDAEGSYVRLHTSDNQAAVKFYPASENKDSEREAANGTYALDNTLLYEYEIKYPNVSAVASNQVNYTFYPSNESKKVDPVKGTGTWTPGLSNVFSETDGIVTKKSVVSKSVQVKATKDIRSDEWIKVKSTINTKTGAVTVYYPDGSVDTTLNMHDSPNWGENNKYYDWGTYMYTTQIYFMLKALSEDGADVYIRNFNAIRMTNTLSVTDASFEYGEYYVDTDNISLTFNDDIDISAFDKCVYITDENKNPVECEITVTGSGKDFNIAVDGLSPYTQYYLNIDGLQAKSMRTMSNKFERLFTTKKASAVYVDIHDESAILNTYGKKLDRADKIGYNVVLKSENSSVDVDILGAVAVYGKNEELLAVKYAPLNVGNNNFELTDIPLGAVSVKVFAWYMKNGKMGSLLHKPDSLRSSAEKEYDVAPNVTLPDFNTVVTDTTISEVGVSSKTVDADGSLYTILILEGQDTPVSEFAAKTVALTYAAVKDGQFGRTFTFEQPSGKYTVYILTDNGEYTNEFEYIRLNDLVENYIKKIAVGSIAQNDIYNKMVEFNAGIGIDLKENFVSERDRKLLNKRMYQKRADLKGKTDTEYMTQFMDNLKAVQAEIKWLDELSEIKYYGLIKEKLEKGIQYTSIEFDDYNRLNDVQKSEVASAFIGKVFEDGDSVKVFFDSCVNETGKNSGSKPSGGSGNGNYGGSKGTSNIGSGVTLPIPSSSIKDEINADSVFNDLNGYDWAKAAIFELAQKGIVNGVDDMRFGPSEFVTREQFVKMLVLAMDCYNSRAMTDFKDVKPDEWYAPYVASAAEKGFVSGESEERFGIGEKITRQDMAVMIYRAFEYKKIVLSEQYTEFLDMDKVSEYAYKAVAALSGKGIIKGNGDNTFDPLSNATRAQAAILVQSLLEGVN